ncbi:hypothetical protein Pla110_30660 [Polystyrenella longa]|uniref:Uncharacterized protein n=1 Tax=Polystyrenella longa TaxID=2528007 RepID=A0A518CQ34_9PLAN|nr:hypothetical protein [Polystyrenella longa]QDU81325.1 hypothetical protein Pla110_30660 [Polystyrenella longa]
MKRLPNLQIRISACLIIILAIGGAFYQWSRQNSEGKETPYPLSSQEDTNAPQNQAQAQTSAGTTPLVSIETPTFDSLPESPKVQSAGRDLLLQSRQQLQQYKPFQARLTQTIRISAQPILARGTYKEGLAQQLRMELEIETQNTRGKMLNVCDGSILWTEFTRHSAELAPEGKPKITRRDLGSILQEAYSTDHVENARYVSDLAMGGLTALFASLEKEMIFRDPTEFSHGGVLLWKLQGTWSPGFLERHHVSNLSKLPRHVPDSVELFLDRKTLFPHRILFTRQQDDKEAPLKMITFDFSDVELQATLTEELFEYDLKGETYDDVTNQYLRRLQEVD